MVVVSFGDRLRCDERERPTPEEGWGERCRVFDGAVPGMSPAILMRRGFGGWIGRRWYGRVDVGELAERDTCMHSVGYSTSKVGKEEKKERKRTIEREEWSRDAQGEKRKRHDRGANW